MAAEPSSHNSTDSWRVQTPTIDYEKCIRCMICWKFCPDDAISISPADAFPGPNKRISAMEAPSIDYNYCKGCGICAYECPEKCIEMSIQGGAGT